ncbi:enoyl-CoA hydratase-related protein [Candidimonas nitroreducens]|nr:enoyl-CoA hydratase-related protein [Candidimonas nitroreducens]
MNMIKTTHSDKRYEVLIDRPQQRNAINAAMYTEMKAALLAAAADPECRAVILSGAGGHFTAGNDLKDFQAPRDENDSPALAFLRTLADLDIPVIAAVEGQAVGIGVTLLQHCDFVYASETARLRMPFVALGLCPEGGSSLLMAQIAGSRNAARWLLAAEPFDARQACEAGLVTAVSAAGQALADARAQADTLAKLPVAALRLTKHMLKQAQREPLARAFDNERDNFRARLQSAEAQDAFRRFFAREKG